MIILFLIKSTLLNINPVFGKAGKILTSVVEPECNPTPENLTFERTVFCLRLNISDDY
jgi:hypothetical protein